MASVNSVQTQKFFWVEYVGYVMDPADAKQMFVPSAELLPQQYA
jgi:hypothetical protein